MKDTTKIPDFYNNYMAKEDETLYEHTLNLLKNLEKLKNQANLEDLELIEASCIYHDIGKINPLFQDRIKNKKSFDSNKEVGHNILSAYIVKEFLGKELKDKDIIINSILNHHNYVDNFNAIYENERLIKDNLQKISKELFGENYLEKDLSKNLKKRELSILSERKNYPSKREILVKGLLYKCDYTASAHSEIEIPNKDFDKRMDGLNYNWNDMQKFSKENSNRNMILIGSTGLGKTEASLLWLGNTKGFYVLPIKTAINAMYERIKNNLYPLDYQENLGLLHGESKSVYLKYEDNKKMQKSVDVEENKFWNYYNITHSMSLPLTITTPDQMFRFAFKHIGYELQLATCSYSKIIIDEIQAYSPDILATLIYGLHKVNMVGGKFAITTATLPPFIKDLLIKENEEIIEYCEGAFLNKKVRHKVELRDKRISSEDIVNFVQEKINDESMKILVVLNTVKSSQKLFDELKEELGEEIKINLLHSKFTVKDRSIKENMIMEDGNTKCYKKVIWVATQVVEASLDIDFDYIFTELSDLSGLLQRLGRCNRKGSKAIDNYNSFVYTKIDEGLYRKSSNKNAYTKRGFIFESLFELSKSALYDWQNKGGNGEMTEEDKNYMINIYFTTQKLKEYEENYRDSSYIKEYKEAYNHINNLKPDSLTIKDVIQEFRNIISVKVIPMDLYNEEKNTILDIVAEINNTKEKLIQIKDINKKSDVRLELFRLKDKINEYTISIEVSDDVFKSEYIEVDNMRIYKLNRRYSFDKGLFKESKENIFEEETLIW